MNMMQRLQAHLDAGGLLSGYDTVHFRWYDEHTELGAPPSILFRPVGGGVANELGQQPDILVAVLESRYGQGQAYDTAIAIRDYLIANFETEHVAQFEILADVNGPFFMTNERPVCELNVRVWTR